MKRIHRNRLKLQNTKQRTWISGVRIWQLDEALRIFCEILEICFLDSAGVQAGLPTTVKGDLLVDGVTDVAHVQSLEKKFLL